MPWLKAFGLSFILFLVLDFVWLGYVMKPFNLQQLAGIGRIKDGTFDVLYLPALLVYLFMSALVVVFILPRIAPGAGGLETFAIGALAGLLVYGVFDMTNMAILKDYPVPFALMDMAWGTFLFGVVTFVVRKFA